MSNPHTLRGRRACTVRAPTGPECSLACVFNQIRMSHPPTLRGRRACTVRAPTGPECSLACVD